MKTPLDLLLGKVRACTVCKNDLPLGPNPILSLSSTSKIMIIGQAPGKKVHVSGIPWDDQSGERLRNWMGVDSSVFYDSSLIALMPMGFCYPGKGRGGDLPPRPECAPLWHEKLIHYCSNIKLTILIGQYAQFYYLKHLRKETLTDTVRAFDEYLPAYLPIVHPSPRNQIWLKKNPWFEKKLVPILRDKVKRALRS